MANRLSRLRQKLDVTTATNKDVADILTLQDECFPEESEKIQKERLEELIEDPSSHVKVCRFKDAFAGYLVLIGPKLRPWVCVEFIAVKRRFAGLGAGAILAEEGFRATKRPLAKSLVRPSNKAALKLNKRFGFARVGRKKNFYADGEDALVLFRHTFYRGSSFSEKN